MRFHCGHILLLALAVLLLAGCQIPRSHSRSRDREPSTRQATAATVSVKQLAARLNLDILDADGSFATLRNESNRVFIIADPAGRLSVNGIPVGPRTGYKNRNGVIYVPEEAVHAIRAALVDTKKPEPYKPEPIKPFPVVRRCVVIDAGHGGKDPGAISVLGYTEKSVNLAVAIQVAQILEEWGLRVELTRSSDRFLELEDRPAVANRLGVDLFVSIHADSFTNSSANGFSVYVRKAPPIASEAAAKSIEKALAASGLRRRGVKEANFRVLTHARCPAVLVEMGFLSNYRDASYLADKGFQRNLALNLAKGICDFLGIDTQSVWS